MYWAILFHDSGKHLTLNPYFKEDFSDHYYLHYVPDKAHPFKGVVIFLETMLKQNLIYYKDEEDKKDFIKYITEKKLISFFPFSFVKQIYI